MLTECWHSVARAIHNVKFLIGVHSFVISASWVRFRASAFRLVSPPEGASYDSRDGLALRSTFSHNGSGAGAPASVSERLGECLGESLGECLGECLGKCLGESLGECLGECLRFISASFAAAASACAWSGSEIVWA